jgi:hypothetical protein
MADDNSKENIILNFETNAKSVRKDTDNLNVSIDQTITSTDEQTKSVKQQEESYKTFKTQLREANAELQKAVQLHGETSTQAINAAKGVAQLKDQMQFAQDLSKQFNPDQKFKALGAATQVAGTGLQGVTAGMALFGGESEDTQKQLLKVQAAMAFSDAISNLSNVTDQLAVLKSVLSNTWTTLTTAKAVDSTATVTNTAAVGANTAVVVAETTAVEGSTFATTAATVATNIWNASLAIALAPVTLIVAGIAALVLGIGYLTGAFGDFSGEAAKATAANMVLNQQMNNLSESSKKANEQMEFSNNHALAMEKASGKSSDAIRKLSEELINQEVAEKRLNAVKAQSIFLEARRIAGLEDATDAQKKTSQDAYKLFQEQNEIYNDSLKARKKLAADNQVAEVQEVTDARIKAEEKAEENRKKEAEKLQKELDKNIQAKKDYLKKQNELDDEFLYLKFDKEKSEKDRKQKEYEDGLKLQSDIAEKEKSIADNLAEEAKRRDDAVQKNKDEVTERFKNNQEILLKYAASGAIKNKSLQKAAIIADAGINLGKTVSNTAAAIGQDLKLGFPANIAPIALDVAVGAMSTASIISGTATALKAVGGGSAPSAPSLPSAPTGIGATPQSGFQASSENQISTSLANANKEPTIVKAFVVASDVTDQQTMDSKIIKQNSFGN